MPYEGSIVERAVLGAWCAVVFLFALPGSLLTLYGLKSNAIRLNRISRALIKNIAIADLGFTLFVNLPVMWGIFLNDWLFGETHCKITQVFEEVFAFADFNMIFALSLSKLAMLLWPLESKTWSRTRSYTVVGTMWTIAIMIGLQTEVFITLGMQNMSSFDQHGGLYMCTLTPDHGHGGIYYLEAVEFSLLTVVPTVAVTISSILLLILAKQRKRTKKEAVLAVILISGVYCICALPIGLLFIVDEWDEVKEMRQVAYYSPFLNSAANFPIYCLTLQTVRNFAKKKLGWISGSSGRSKDMRMVTISRPRTTGNSSTLCPRPTSSTFDSIPRKFATTKV